MLALSEVQNGLSDGLRVIRWLVPDGCSNDIRARKRFQRSTFSITLIKAINSSSMLMVRLLIEDLPRVGLPCGRTGERIGELGF